MCAAIIFFRALLVLLKWATTAGSSLFFLYARYTRIASVEKVMWFQQCRTRVMAGSVSHHVLNSTEGICCVCCRPT